jgi:TIGR03009 family protein
MKKFCLVMTGLLACIAAAVAQQPAAQIQPAQPASAVDRAKLLDQHLAAWESRMKDVSSLEMIGIERVDKDHQFKYVDQWKGFAKYSKPNLATLVLQRKDKPEIFEKWICSGNSIYQYVPAEKKIVIHQLQAKKDGAAVSDENFLGFMFGMKADDAKKRYNLQLSKDKENDQYYVYIDIVPREDRDKADFEVARLVLNKDTYLPRQLWFRHPNGNETTWSIPQAKSGVQIDRREFQAPEAPKGWSMVQGVKAGDVKAGDPKAQPRIVRPQGQ